MIPAVCQPSSPPPSPATRAENVTTKESTTSSEEVPPGGHPCPNCGEELHLVAARRTFTAKEELLFQE